MTTVTFPGRFTSLDKICDFVTQEAKAAGLNDADIYAVQLAVDEATTNIIEHAYGGEDRGDIQCTCEVTAEGLCVTLQDCGCPFDPTGVSEPSLDVPLEDVKPRGLGLFFMRKMMDDVKFEYTPDTGNILMMIKRKKR